MKAFLSRVQAYATGDFKKAAGVSEDLLRKDGEVAWINEADEPTSEYALQLSLRSAGHAEAAADKLTEKASSLTTVLLAVLAVSVGATGVALGTRHDPPVWQWLAFGTFCVVDALLVLALLNAFLATSPVSAIALNAARIVHANGASLALATRQEARVWHHATLVAMEITTRRGTDLINARRLLVFAIACGSLAITFSFIDTA